jgi:Cdc6-like AAA superfamily ATPase
MDSATKLALLNEAFFPSAPITSSSLFAGRIDQIQRACDAINERGQHFAIYGDRGVGKTSLANILDSRLTNVVVSKVTCNRDENFKNLWEKALSKIRFQQKKDGIGYVPEKLVADVQLELFLPSREKIDALDVQNVLEKVSANLLFLFDEFDSIAGRDVQSAFADTIKALSDNAPQVTIGVVGIAEDVDGLIGEHPSLERCLKQIEMPRMSRVELNTIIENGMRILGMQIDPAVSSQIVEFSSGFPHYTHLLGKFASKRAIDRSSLTVDQVDLVGAIADSIENANQSIKTAYRKAVLSSHPHSKFENVVAACALVESDDAATFAARDLVEPYKQICGIDIVPQDLTYTLQKLCEKDRGCVLQRVTSASGVRYKFGNALMKTFVKLRLSQHGTYESPMLIQDSESEVPKMGT